MAELDQLSISISANATSAIKAIEKLTKALEQLDDAMIPSANGLHRTADALERIASLNGDIAGVAKSLKKLGDASNSLSNVGKNGKQAGDAVSKLAKKLSGDLGITDKNGISQLSKALHDFYSSTTSGEMQNAYDKIERIARNFGHVEGEISDARKQALAFISELNNRKINNPLDYTKEFGDSSNGRRIRANLGLKNAVKTGGSDASEVAKDLLNNDFGGVNADAYRALAEEAEKARQIIRDTAEESMTMSEAFSAGGEAAIKATEAYRNLGQALADAVGMSQKQLGDAMSGGDGFLGEDPTEQADAMRQFALLGENLLNMGNPLENITTGLQELGNIELSDTLNNIQYIKDAVSKIGGDSGARAGDALTQIAYGLHAFDDVDIPNFGDSLTNLAVGLRGLGSGQMVTASQVLPFIADGLRQLNGITITTDFEKISGLASAVAGFGYAKVEKTITNLPVLTSSLRELIDMLANAPEVSERTLMLLNTISQINVKGNNLSKSIDGASSSLKRFTGYAHKAHKASVSLASIAGKLYANFFMLFRALRWFGNSIDLAAQLVEVQNVVDVTFADMSGKMNQFAKDATDSLGMSELTAKKIGSQFQAMGTAMNIPAESIRRTTEFVDKATNGYAEVSDSMADMSMNLTKLTGDMASFYNLDYEDVATKMSAIFTGQTRPLRVFGLDLTQATLQEWALANGMDVDIKKMTQAEKTMLRYQYVMANTTAAHGDFERTINSFSNQIRIAKERINQLRIVLGKIGMYTFKPLVKNFNSAMNAIIDNATATFNALGKIFGWQIEWSDAGVLQDEADGLEDVADGYDDAADSAKKFKNFLLGIDELNLLPDDKDSGKGDDDLSDLYGDFDNLGKDLNIKETEGVFDSLYDTLFKLGKRIGEVEKEWLQGIDWDSIYDKARNFGKGLADFLNGYLSDAELFYEKGKFIANGINTIANAIDAFFREFNGWQLGVDIGNLINGFTENIDWDVIQSAAEEMAHDIAMIINGALLTTDWSMVGSTIANALNTGINFLEVFGRELKWTKLGDAIAQTINGFAKDFNAAKLASAINYWSKGITSAVIKALEKINWNLIGRKIGEFLRKLDIGKITAELAKVFVKALEGLANIWSSAFAEAPVETALLTAIALIKPRNIGGALSTVFGKSFNFFDTKKLTGALTAVISKLPVSLPQLTLGVGAGFAEFATLKDTIHDMYEGTQDVVGGIEKIAATSAITGTVMTAIFGFPAGTIAVAIAGCVGAVKGFSDAVIEAGTIAEKSWIGDAIKVEGGVGISKYLEETGKLFEDAGKKYDDFLDKVNATDLENARDKIDGDMEDISIALQRLSLSDNIDELSVQMETIVGMFATFKADIENVFNEEVDAILSAGASGLVDDAAGMAALAQGIEYEFVQRIGEKEAELQRVMKDMQNGVIDYEQGMTKIMEIRGEINALNMSQMERVESSLDSVNLAIDFSGLIDPDTQEASLLEMEASFEIYRNQIEEYVGYVKDGNDVILESMQHVGETANLLGDKAGAKQAAEYINQQLQRQESDIKEAYDKYAEDMRNIEAQAWANIGKIIEQGQKDGLDTWEISARVEDYVENVFKPIEENIQKQSAEVGIVWNSSISNMVDQMLDDLGNVVSSPTAVGDKLPDLVEWWDDNQSQKIWTAQGALYSLASTESEATSNAKDFVESFGGISEKVDNVADSIDGVNEEFSVLSNAHDLTLFNSLRGAADKTADSILGVKHSSGQAADSILMINRSMKRMDASNISRIKDEFDKTVLKTNDVKNGIDNLAISFGTVKDKIKNAKTFESVKKDADDVLLGFQNIKDKGSDAASILVSNINNMTGQIKTAYSGITSETDTFMVKFNSEISKLFSNETWGNMVTNIPDTFRKMWEQTINVMKSMWGQFAKWVNENAVIEMPKTKIGDIEVGGGSVKLKVPKYEKGGFPEDGLFFANHTELVGQFDNGKTAVANNDQITTAIENAVYRAMSNVMANYGNQSVNVELRGDASSFFTAMVKENNNAIKRTGSSPIRV